MNPRPIQVVAEPDRAFNESSLAKLRLLVLGGGTVVSECHLPALQQLGMAERALVVDVAPRNLSVLRQRCLALRVRQADFRRVLSENGLRDEFDAAIVTLPNCFHEDAVEQALEAGLHVLCEKPLTLSRESCLRLAKIADQAGKILSVAMVRRLLPSITALRAGLRENLIGELISVDIEDGGPFKWPADSPFYFRQDHGGVLANMGVHYLDLLEDLLGLLHPIRYWDDCAGGVEANFDYRLQTDTGVPVRLALSYTHKLRNTLVFKGTKGELIVDKDEFDGCIWKTSDGRLTANLVSPQPFKSGSWKPTFESCFIEQAWEFAESISTGNHPRVNATQAAHTMELIQTAYELRTRKRTYHGGFPSVERPVLEPAKVVVTGGTGFIGSKLVERLTEIGFRDIVVPVRTYMSGANVGRFPVQLRRIDLLAEAEVRDVLKGARYVFHLAYGNSGENASRITVDGTCNVVRAAAAIGAESVVVLSTATVFGQPDGIVDEEFPYSPGLGEYGRTKAKAEQQCLAFAQASKGTRIIVLNPTAVYGPGGQTFTEMPSRMAASGTFCWIDDGAGNANYVYIDNLVDAILLAAKCPEAHAQRFLISDGSCPWKELLSPMVRPWLGQIPSYSRDQLRMLHRERPQPGVREMLRALIIDNRQFLSAISRNDRTATCKRWLRSALPGIHRTVQDERLRSRSNSHTEPPPLPELPSLWLADLFGSSRTQYSSARAKRNLGWTPRVDRAEGQRRAVEWLKYVRLIEE